MLIIEFKKWLELIYPESNTTVNNRISNCKNVEKYYGDLDNHYEEDKCSKILVNLSYSVDDERNNRKPTHIVPINGNLRTGSATLKQSVKLYVEFRTFLLDSFPDHAETQDLKAAGSPTIEKKLKERLSISLKQFAYNYETHKDTLVLQNQLRDHLAECLLEFNWVLEFKPSDSCRDSVDIFGHSELNSLKIIIEIDAHRADQVAKKFISRSSLFLNENILYVSLCYPGTDKMSKKECSKYFAYCSELSDFISNNTSINKQYIGYYL